MAQPLLEIKGISKTFPGVRALDGVNLELSPGEILALVGENGAGKSTLMKILSGVHTEYDGDLILDGRKVSFRGPADARRAGIAIIFQELSMIGELSAAENMFLGREPSRFHFIDYKTMNRDAGRRLRELNLEIDPSVPVGRHKVGQQQLVEIAKALSLDARLLILDEPTSALSDAETEKLIRVLQGLRQQGTAIIFISHRLAEVFTLADRVVVLRDGRTVAGYARADATPARVIRDMVGREVREKFPRSVTVKGPEALRVESLTVRHPLLPGEDIVRDVSFAVRQGEILGLAGLMGSGRSETLEGIFGAFPGKTGGRIFLRGEPVAIRCPRDAMERGIGLLTEDRKRLGLVLSMDVKENLTLAGLRRFSPAGWLQPGRETAVAGEYVRDLGIKTAGLRANVGTLSGGNQQKVILGKWLINHPSVLFLDEPTRGVDVGAKDEIYKLIDRLTGEGMAVVLVSSDLPEIIALADRVLVMCEGRCTGELEKERITEVNIMQLATRFRERSMQS